MAEPTPPDIPIIIVEPTPGRPPGTPVGPVGPPPDGLAPEGRTPRQRLLGTLGCLGLITVGLVIATTAVLWFVFDGNDDSDLIDDDPFADTRWVQVERFDLEPSALTPAFTTAARGDGHVAIEGFDGCREVLGRVTIVDDVVTATTFAPDECPIPTATPFSWEVGDRLVIDDGRLVVWRDESPTVVFVQNTRLPYAPEDDLVGAWLLDQAAQVEFRRDPFGERVERPYLPSRWCLADERPTWSYDGATLTLDGTLVTQADDCRLGGDGPIQLPPEYAVEFVARRVLAAAPVVYLDGDDRILDTGIGTVTLRPIPNAVTTTAPINVGAGTAFGIAPGAGVSADAVLAAVVPQLGPATFDSGWLDLPPGGMAPCPDTDDEYRELWWGDLAFSLWRRGERGLLSSWRLGQPSADLPTFIVPEFDRPADVEPSGLRTEAGLGIGDPADRLVGPNIGRVDISSGEPGEPTVEFVTVSSTAGGGAYLVVDGRIETIETISLGC